MSMPSYQDFSLRLVSVQYPSPSLTRKRQSKQETTKMGLIESELNTFSSKLDDQEQQIEQQSEQLQQYEAQI